MKILFLFLLLSCFNTYSNILLQQPKNLSISDIQELAKNWETQFSWKFGFGCYFSCCYEQERSSFLLQIFGIPIRSYQFQYVSTIKKLIKFATENQRGYFFEKPLKFNNETPIKLQFDELCTMLKNKNFIFYTGAGLSASGDVATMSKLEKSLKLSDGIKEFVKTVFLNPQTIITAFTNFCESAIYGLPTRAHYALHQIAQHRNIGILTENVDLLQQRTGSAPLFVHSDALLSVDKQDLLAIDIIVCIGLSHDDCGLIAHYKQKNPNGILVAINLEMPNYLSSKDFIVQNDLQIILPNLASFLCEGI